MLAYRSWSMNPDYSTDPYDYEYYDMAECRLMSLSRPMAHEWRSHSNWAKCIPHAQEEHMYVSCTQSPNKGCKQEFGCGFYSYKDYEAAYRATDTAKTFPPRCLGIIWAWGTVIEHEDDIIRSEIVDIWHLIGIPYMYPNAPAYKNDFLEIAYKMKLPYFISQSKAETLSQFETLSVKLMEK